jgi:hypothetical protein
MIAPALEDFGTARHAGAIFRPQLLHMPQVELLLILDWIESVAFPIC